MKVGASGNAINTHNAGTYFEEIIPLPPGAENLRPTG
jgi:hypothetical protein